MKIEVGDYIVTADRWRIEARPAIKVTAQCVFWKSDHSDHHFRVRLTDVVFAGPKEHAERLAQQLRSSFAQQVDDERAARERRKKRDEKFIEAAKASHTSTTRTET